MVAASDTLTMNLDAKTAITYAANFHTPCLLPLLRITHGSLCLITGSLVMPSKSSRNLRVHNAFTLGPQQPTIPCSHPNCPRYFFNRAGCSNHIRAAHPLGVPPPNPPDSPQAFVQPSSPQSGPSQSPPSSPTTFHLPSSLSSHAFEPAFNKDNPVWYKKQSLSPAYSSESPSEDKSWQSSEHLDSPLQETPLNSDVDFDFPPVDFMPFSDTKSLPEDLIGMDSDPKTTLFSPQHATSHSEANSPCASTLGSDIDQTSMLPSHAADNELSSNSSTDIPPHRVRHVYHWQMNSKHLLTLSHYTYSLNQLLGQICNEDGVPLPQGTPPSPHKTDRSNDDWTLYTNRVQFEVADFLYHCNQMSVGDINFVTGLWVAFLVPHNDSPPFKNAKDMYDTIDSTPLGNIPWQSFTLNYNGPPPDTLGPDGKSPLWTTANYDIWFRDLHLLVQELIANPKFKGQFDFMPEYSTDGQHRFENFMSGDWAWKQAVSGSQIDRFQCLL